VDRPTNQGSTAPLTARLARLRSRIARAAERSGRPAEAVALVAVAKEADDEAVAALLRLGVTDFAENRVQKLAARPEALREAATWHLIGPLQSNKVAKAVALADEFHAVDRAEVVPLLARAAAARGRSLPVWLQVNIAAEPQKHGATPADAATLARALAAEPSLELRGLMAIAPYATDPEASRPHFRALRDLSLRLLAAGDLPSGATGLSIGMSGDFEVAIEEGATLVRVGSALFREEASC